MTPIKRFVTKLTLTVLVLWAIQLLLPQPTAGPDQLTVAVLDVGQGDSIFIQTPKGVQVLIDGGPDQAVISKLGGIMSAGDRTLDMIVLTHPHADHLVGLLEVLNRYEVVRGVTSSQVHES